MDQYKELLKECLADFEPKVGEVWWVVIGDSEYAFEVNVLWIGNQIVKLTLVASPGQGLGHFKNKVKFVEKVCV